MTAIAVPASSGRPARLLPGAPARNHPFRSLLRSEAVLLSRTGAVVVWTALLPVVALIVIGSVPGLRHPQDALGGRSYLDVYLPIIMMASLCLSTISLLPPTLATYRERGVLRRLSTTPVPPSRLLAAQATLYAGLALVVSVILLVVAVVAYDVRLPSKLLGFAISLLLVGAAVTGLGVMIAALAPTAKVANALSTLTFFPLMFFAGLWLPRAAMPPVLRGISDWTPLGAGVQAVQATMDGHWPPVSSLLVLLGWTLISGAVAARTFRWE